MKYAKIFTGCLLSFVLTGSALAEMPSSGTSDIVEWNVTSSWDVGAVTVDFAHSLDGKFIYVLTDQNEVKIFNAKGQLQGTIPVDSGVSSIDIAPLGEFLYLIDNTNKRFKAVSVAMRHDIDTLGSPFKGVVDAPVTLVLFTDFQCPYCSKMDPIIEEVLKRNPKTVKVVLKHMPLQFHKMAKPAAYAAIAAEQQGKFWEFHDKLFAEKQLTEEKINQFAVDLKLDIDKFQKDIKSPETFAKVEKDIADAKKAGVTGTPTVFINGRKPQQRSPQAYQALINDELKTLAEK